MTCMCPKQQHLIGVDASIDVQWLERDKLAASKGPAEDNEIYWIREMLQGLTT